MRMVLRDGLKVASPFSWLMLVGVFAMLVTLINSHANAARDSVYTVARFPIAAQAKDAVTAKRLALEDGQVRAFRSLLKRLVPVTAYGRLPRLQLTHVQDMIEGFSVRGEQNSRTEYLATLKFQFRKKHVQQLLKSYGLPFVDQQAPEILVVPHYFPTWPGRAVTGEVAAAEAPDERVLKSLRKDWLAAWRDLDLAHALVPVKLKVLHDKIHPDTLRDLMQGKSEAFKIVQEEYDAKNILLVLAGPAEPGKFSVRYIGRDSVGKINLMRTYRIYDNDFLYSAELASIVGLGVLEGRWKSRKAGSVTAAAPQSWGIERELRVEVEFSGLYEWQQIRQRLTRVPGIDELKIGRLSARGADITLSHSGDVNALRSALQAQNLSLEDYGGQYKIRSR